MAPPSQVQHLNWHSLCSESFCALLLFTKPFSTCDVLPKVSSWRKFFFSFRVGTPLISKVEIITWSCSFCFFLYNFSSYPSIKKTKIQITTLLMENSTPPSPHSRKILSLSLLWVQMLLSSVSGGVALYNSAICSFLCMTCSPMG